MGKSKQSSTKSTEPQVKEKPEKKSGLNVLIIVGTIIIAAIILGGVTLWNKYTFQQELDNLSTEQEQGFNNEITNLKQQLEKLEQVQEELNNEVEVVKESAEKAKQDMNEPANWPIYQYKDYIFNYPKNWIVQNEKSEDPLFKKIKFVESEAVKAEMTFPIPEIGFEEYDFEKQTRKFTKADKEYTVDFWTGKPIKEDAGFKNSVVMMIYYIDENENRADSSLMFANWTTAEEFIVYEKIYNSVK